MLLYMLKDQLASLLFKKKKKKKVQTEQFQQFKQMIFAMGHAVQGKEEASAEVLWLVSSPPERLWERIRNKPIERLHRRLDKKWPTD